MRNFVILKSVGMTKEFFQMFKAFFAENTMEHNLISLENPKCQAP